MNTKKVTTILITLIVIEFSIIGIFIKDYKNSLVTVSIVNDNNIKLSNAFTKVKEDTVNKEVDNNKKITIRFYNIDNNSSSYKSNITIPNEEINPKFSIMETNRPYTPPLSKMVPLQDENNNNSNINNISKINESIIHNHYPEMVYDTKKGKYYNSKTKVYYDFK